jgi:hypothetical protein
MTIKIGNPTVKALIYSDCSEASVRSGDINYFDSCETSEHGSWNNLFTV